MNKIEKMLERSGELELLMRDSQRECDCIIHIGTYNTSFTARSDREKEIVSMLWANLYTAWLEERSLLKTKLDAVEELLK